MASLSPQAKGVLDLVAFRKQMGEPLLKSVIKEHWGEDVLEELSALDLQTIDMIESRNDQIIKEKIQYIKKSIWFNKLFELLGIVKYVGISGSLASGKYKSGEDLDLFIVTADGVSWIYRGFLKLLLGKKARLYEDIDIADTLCINFIAEERGAIFDPDIFTMHELIHLISVTNPGYKDLLINSNKWLTEVYGVSSQKVKEKKSIKKFLQKILYFPIRILDYFAYQLQVLFMKITKHKPELKRIKRGRKAGRIEFYPSNYRSEVMEQFWREKEDLEKILTQRN